MSYFFIIFVNQVIEKCLTYKLITRDFLGEQSNYVIFKISAKKII